MIVQVEIGSAQQVNSPKYLVGVHQPQDKINVSKKTNIATFHNLDLRKTYNEIYGQRYPRDSLFINYEKKYLYWTM